MVGRECKYASVISWADEVEREEEEEAAASAGGGGRAQRQQRQKPNHFGSATPRQVVQDKRIDRRKLHLHLHQHSPLRHEFENEKLQKQTTLNLTPQLIQSPILFVPPLKYPPKFVAGVPYESWVSVSLNASNSGSQHYIYRHEKENRFLEERKAHNFMSNSAKCGNRRKSATQLVEARKAHRKGRNLEQSLVDGNKPRVVSATRKGKLYGRNSLGLHVVNKRIGPCEVQDKRMAAKAKQPAREIQDELGMGIDVTPFQVSHNSKAMEEKWQRITRKSPRFARKASRPC